MRTGLTIITLLMLAFADAAQAQMWVDNATISATTTLQPNRLCYTDGRDIACDGAAGLFITSGTLQFTKVSSTNISTTALTVNGVAITGSGGASALSGLTDVSASFPASGMLLRYNGSKWESVGASAALSTTTMVQNWPDAIQCTDGTYTRILYFRTLYSGGATYEMPLNGTYTILYTLAGAYSSNSNFSSLDCVTNAWSISQLYAQGRAYNFIGSSGSTALGDRIVSGTLAAIANSATGYISLTTGVTNWGYLSSGASYLPNLSSNLVSSTAGGVVSATYGYFKYISATNGLGGGSMATLSDVSASSPASGMLLRYNGSKWESVGASAALSTTTMDMNWPDAITCTSGNAKYFLYIKLRDSTATQMIYNMANSTAELIFNNPAATYNSNSNLAGFDCISKSVAQLYAAGLAFNFIGGQYGGSANQVIFHNGTQGVGDNNFTYVSSSAMVSVTGISATTVSATSLQLNGASVTCGSGTLGVIRRSPTTGRLQVCQ